MKLLKVLVLCCLSCAVTLQAVEVRLVGGRVAQEGRVEVLYNGTWGTVCDDRWGFSEAEVVCRKLGFVKALRPVCCAHFGWGSGRIWLDDVDCDPGAQSLGQCSHRGWGEHDCSHIEDAGVICASEPQTTSSVAEISPSIAPTVVSSPGSTASTSAVNSSLTPTHKPGAVETFRRTAVPPHQADCYGMAPWAVVAVNAATLSIFILGLVVIHRFRRRRFQMEENKTPGKDVMRGKYNENTLLRDNEHKQWRP